MEIIDENGGLDDNIEFDNDLAEFVEVPYTTPECEPLPFRKKSTKLSQLQGFPALGGFCTEND